MPAPPPVPHIPSVYELIVMRRDSSLKTWTVVVQKKHRNSVSYKPLLQPFVRDTRLSTVSQYQCDLEEKVDEFSFSNYKQMRESTAGLFSASLNFKNLWDNKVNKRLNPTTPFRVLKDSPIVPINATDTKARLWHILRYCHPLQSPLLGLAI